jgi:hypothetical protein
VVQVDLGFVGHAVGRRGDEGAGTLAELPTHGIHVYQDIIELDFFQYPGTIGKQGERPQAGYILLALHAQSNLIFGVETPFVTESIERMWGADSRRTAAMEPSYF